jgi:hypothetical protein
VDVRRADSGGGGLHEDAARLEALGQLHVQELERLARRYEGSRPAVIGYSCHHGSAPLAAVESLAAVLPVGASFTHQGVTGRRVAKQRDPPIVDPPWHLRLTAGSSGRR